MAGLRLRWFPQPNSMPLYTLSVEFVRLPSIFEPFPSTNENYAFSGEWPASYWSLSHHPSSSRKLLIRHGFLRRYAFASLGE
ncbi:hypothetical protein GBA52_007211 [Prunus armeniaca]|nr:hypothetical protein GBA52_007211 [Prunus armeniaca]